MKVKDFYEAMYRECRPASTGASTHPRVKIRLSREEAAFRLLDGGDRFLDIGCGEGELVLLATQRYNECYGIDISDTRIQRARAKAPKTGRIYFQAADITEDIPFSDAYFDAVSCVVTLEHIFDPAGMLKEIHRVLRPDGKFVTVIPNVAYLPRRLSAVLGKPPKTSSAAGVIDGGTLHYFTLSSIVALLEQEGFSTVEKSNAGTGWFLRNWWKSLLASSLVIKAVKTDKARLSKQSDTGATSR